MGRRLGSGSRLERQIQCKVASGDTCNLVTKKVEDGSPSCCDNGECDYFWWLDLGEKHLFS